MKSIGLKYFTDLPIVLVALFLFLICFIGFIFWVNRSGSTRLYQRLAHLPLSESESLKEPFDVTQR